MELSEAIGQARQVASVFPTGGPLDDLFSEWSGNAYRLEKRIKELEAENAGLRGDVDAAEKGHDDCIKVCERLRDNNK